MRVNFTDVKGGDFEALPGGTYIAKITDGTMTETKNAGKLPAGTPGINWEFTVQEGEFAGRKLWTNTWIADSTMVFLKNLLAATGRFNDDQLGGDLDFEIDDVVGSDVKLVVKTRIYDGDTVNDIKRIRALSDDTSKETASSLLP